MTLEELLKALNTLQDGPKYVEAIKAIIEQKEGEIGKKATELKTVKTALKEAEGKANTASERLSQFYSHFEIDENVEDLEEAFEAVAARMTASKDGGASAPEVTQLQKELAKLQRDFKKLQTTNETTEKQFQDERGKRHKALKEQIVLAEMVKNKIKNPELLMKLVLDSVKIGDDDSLIFENENKEEMSVAEGIKAFADAHLDFVINGQNQGASSNNGHNSDGGGSFASSLIKDRQQPENLQKAEEIYFGKQ